MKDQFRFTPAVILYFDVFVADTVIKPGAQRLDRGLLGGKPSGQKPFRMAAFF